MKNTQTASAWFYGLPGLHAPAQSDPIDALCTRYCEICSAEMGRMSKAAWEAAGRDCGCRGE